MASYKISVLCILLVVFLMSSDIVVARHQLPNKPFRGKQLQELPPSYPIQPTYCYPYCYPPKHSESSKDTGVGVHTSKGGKA